MKNTYPISCFFSTFFLLSSSYELHQLLIIQGYKNMSAAIQYTPPAIQVTRDDVCYLTPDSAEVQHGFLVVTYMGDEKLNSALESGSGALVPTYELTACPIIIQNQLNDKKVVVLRDRTTLAVVYGSQTLNSNGTVSTLYFNIDSTPYTGNINNLELAGDVLNYSSPTVFCQNGVNTITRTDIWDERRNLIAVVWQNMLGGIIPEPTSSELVAGSCNLTLDTEIITQVDNRLNPNSSISGTYCYFYRVNVHDSQGNIVYSRTKLSNGANYTPIGKVSTQPLMPPVTAGMQRLTAGQEWISDELTQSVAFAVEYANLNNRVEVTAPDSNIPVYLDRINYHGHWSVDGDNDACLLGVKIRAIGTSKAIISYTKQPQLIEVDPTVGLDPLDSIIPVPPILDFQ
jgi:hypothetical protein